MKYYIIAGEASGDLHGSNLIKALKKQDNQATIRCWGGDLMEAAGGTLVKHYRDLAFMGFLEVIKHLSTILGNIRWCKNDILDFQPDVIIYIDYPGFNMRIARWTREKGFKNHYYISPQIWAWKENRIKAIKRDLDALYVILPFEKDYYRAKHNHSVAFVGNPLVEVINKELKSAAVLPTSSEEERPIIALLPGSRKQEIDKMMPLFLAIVAHFPQYQFVIAGAPGIDPNWYEKFTIHPSVSLIHNQTYSLLKNAFAAIVTSGTATLETALFNVPQLVCYKSSAFSYAIAKRIVKLDYISLVNLIMGKEVVKELIQNDCTVEQICTELNSICSTSKRTTLLNDYRELTQKLGKMSASETVAKHILNALQ